MVALDMNVYGSHNNQWAEKWKFYITLHWLRKKFIVYGEEFEGNTNFILKCFTIFGFKTACILGSLK